MSAMAGNPQSPMRLTWKGGIPKVDKFFWLKGQFDPALALAGAQPVLGDMYRCVR